MSRSVLDVRRLVLLREVQLRGSITAAARSLSYTHSAVSQQLSQLERETGVSLLEKAGRGVRLTAAAEELVQHTDEVLAVLERAEADLAASESEVRGTVRIAAFSTISRALVPRLLRDLEERHPALDVRFRQVEPEQGLVLLSSRRLDVLVADGYPGSSGAVPRDLRVDLLAHDPIHPYLPGDAAPGTPADLARARWVLEPEGTESHAWVRRLCRELGFEPDVAHESPDLLFHLRMVEEGLAAAFLPDLLVRESRTAVRPTDLPGPGHSRRISFVCRAGAHRRPAVAACREAFAERLR